MASNAHVSSRRKHRRSPSDELEETTKRHKHRHHHRHSSRRRKEHETRDEGKSKHEEDESEFNEGEGLALSPPPPLVGVLSGSSQRADYDMEEGEILEDEGSGGGVNEVRGKRTDSDLESGEIKVAEVPVDNHSCNKEVGDGLCPKNNLDRYGDLKTLGDDRNDDELGTYAMVCRKETKTSGSRIHNETSQGRNSSAEHHGNGNVGHESREEDDNWLPKGPVKESRNQRSYSDDESDVKDRRKSLSSDNTGGYKILVSLSSRDRKHEEVNGRNRLRSHDRDRERSRSRSTLHDVVISKTSHPQDPAFYVDNQRTISDSDDEEMVGRYRDYRHGSRDLLRGRSRERSSSYNRYSGRGDRHHSHETWDKERMMSRETWDRNREGSWDTRDRYWEGREADRERRREEERDRERERERERERARNRKRDRERERAREREREKDRDRERDRGRNREKDGRRDKDRDKESDRVSRNYKHANANGEYGGRDRYGDSKYERYIETDDKEWAKKNDPESLDGQEHKVERDENEQEDYQEVIALQLVDQEEEDLNRIKEESRRRRQAILEKYKIKQLEQQEVPCSEEIDKKHVEQASSSKAAVNVVPIIIDAQGEGPDTYVAETSFSVGKSPPKHGISPTQTTNGAGELGDGTPKSERSSDMFCDDIFGESPAGVHMQGKGNGLAIERSGLHDNWDDAEGYYSYRFGEIFDGRYEVTAAQGKGVFSTVVRAKDLKAGAGDPGEVAIKIIRNNETMYKAGLEELVVLKKLVGADPEDKRHCVRFLSSFKYRNHLCLVFESLHMNLREVLKKFGRNIGLKLTAVRAYAKQLFIALKHLRNCGVLHCDIKPDNMLVNESKNVLKLCDFGNAMFAGKNEITPYLVSRFYRAPEIILGLPYDHPMDIWSVGCCLFELYTGKVLFPGPTNNDMLRLHMDLKGPFPKKMLRKGAFTDQHFDQDLNFLSTEEDPVTKKTIKRLILNIRPKDIGSIVMSSPGEDPKMLVNFKDLLEKIFTLDPDKRITVSQALSHPFITGK